MADIKVGTPKTITTPINATQFKIVHEWGDIVYALQAAPVGAHPITVDSIGVHKLTWLDENDAVVRNDFYDAYVPLITSAEFFTDYPDLDDFEDDFARLERQVRLNIQTFTGDKFGPYVNKTMEIQGDGGDSLELPVRVLALTSIDTNYGDSLLDIVEVSPNDKSFLQRHSRFRGSSYYDVKSDVSYSGRNMFSANHIFTLSGDFGWEYVPTEVKDAAGILIADLIGSDDIAEMRRKGVFETKLGDFSLRLNADQWGTTGNTMADNMLAPFVKLGLGLV